VIDREHPFAERILNLIPINNLGPRQQDQALQAGELFEYKKKKVVFEAGSRDPYTYYLLDGDLALESAEASPLEVSAGSEQAQRALAQLQPRRYTARTLSPSVMYRIERAILDQLLTEEQELEDQASIVEVSELEEDEEEGDWMTRLLSSELFTRLPHENIQRFFTELEPLPTETGDVIVEQGSHGDYLYIVAEGKCAVSRVAPRSQQELQLAVLKEGDAFGEESLISNSPCNASVKVINPGFLMRLPKHSFEELVTKATLKPLTWTEACSQVEQGARWLDVRFSDEHDMNAIEGSLNIPLNTLRLEARQLQQDTAYIVYCDSGARSSTGAFLLARMGLEAYYLAGGLDRSPLGQEVGVATDISRAKPVPKAPPEPEPGPETGEDAPQAPATAGGFEFEIVSEDQAQESQAAPESESQPESLAPEPESAASENVAPAPAPAQPPTAAPEPAATQAHQDQLATLRAERDKAASYARKGAETVKELKGRYEELRQAAVAERNRRQELERELADQQAATKRQLELEQSRFNSELDKARKKAEESGQSTSALEQQLKTAQEELQAVQKQIQELEEAKVSSDVAFQDTAADLQEQLSNEQNRARQAEEELQNFRAEVEEQLTSTQQAIRIKEAEASELEHAVQSAEAHLREQKQEVEGARAQFEEDLKQAEAKRQEMESRLRSEKAGLEAEATIQEKRAASLDQREIDLQDSVANREAEFAKREAAISQQEIELSEERASWQDQIDAAIARERERLEASVADEQEAKGLMDAEAAEALADQRCEELRNEFEALAVAAKAEYESQLAAAQSGAEPQLEELRNSYEAKLTEQEALREDEHRRLEAENLHLRDALSEAQRIIKEHKTESSPPPTEPDLVIEEVVETPSPSRAPSEPPAVPVIEVPEEPQPRGAEADGRERVIGPAQLAEIRRKMQEKLAAHRK